MRLQPVVHPLVHFDLGQVGLQPTSDINWEEEADVRIDAVRRRDALFKINFQQSSILPTDLSLEVEQMTHVFPFGAAIWSESIADCWDAGEDSPYCSFVNDNFNWVVDSF